MDEMTNAIREAAKTLRLESTVSSSEAKLTGVFHDWGVLPGCAWANRSLEDGSADGPSDLILYDVLMPPHAETVNKPIAQEPTVYEKIVSSYYRYIFAVSFLIQRYISKFLAVFFFLSNVIPMTLFRLSRTYDIDTALIEQREVPIPLNRLIYMCYPYVTLLFKTMPSHMTLPKDLTLMPVLYMYGTEKRSMFHDYVSLKILERENNEGRSKSNAIAVHGAGHYLYVQKADLCIKSAKNFMEKN